jgi:hypothetical protein
MDCFDYERFVVKKPVRSYLKLCLPSIPVKKRLKKEKV